MAGGLYNLETVTWRTLLGRAAIFYAARQSLGEFADLAFDPNHPAIDRALDALNDTVDIIAQTSTDDTAFISALVTEYGSRISDIGHARPLQKDEADLLSELQLLIVRANATDPFQILFSKVSRLAANLYGDQWREPRLLVANRMAHPRQPANDPYCLSANTIVQADGPVVTLSIFPRLLGPACYAAIPFVFVHECVCHVPARQDRDCNSSPFAEGLMAWVGWHFFHRWAMLIDRSLAPAALQHGDELHDILRGSGNPMFYPRRAGYRSADRLMGWFHQELDEPPEEAESRVARLAVELNVIDVALDRKDNFVTRLRTIDEDTDLGDRLRAWAEGLTSAEDVI